MLRRNGNVEKFSCNLQVIWCKARSDIRCSSNDSYDFVGATADLWLKIEFFSQRIKCTFDIALPTRLIRLSKNLTLSHQKTACRESHEISWSDYEVIQSNAITFKQYKICNRLKYEHSTPWIKSYLTQPHGKTELINCCWSAGADLTSYNWEVERNQSADFRFRGANPSLPYIAEASVLFFSVWNRELFGRGMQSEFSLKRELASFLLDPFKRV